MTIAGLGLQVKGQIAVGAARNKAILVDSWCELLSLMTCASNLIRMCSLKFYISFTLYPAMPAPTCLIFAQLMYQTTCRQSTAWLPFTFNRLWFYYSCYFIKLIDDIFMCLNCMFLQVILLYSSSCPWYLLPSNMQYLSCDACLEVKREDNQNCCVRQLCTMKALLDEQFLQFSGLGFVTLGPFHCA